MPRKGVRKDNFTLRITPDARAWITGQARERDITDGEMLRWMLTYAAMCMPGDYRPERVAPEKRRPGT